MFMVSTEGETSRECAPVNGSYKEGIIAKNVLLIKLPNSLNKKNSCKVLFPNVSSRMANSVKTIPEGVASTRGFVGHRHSYGEESNILIN